MHVNLISALGKVAAATTIVLFTATLPSCHIDETSAGDVDEAEEVGVAEDALERLAAKGQLGIVPGIVAKGFVSGNSLPPQALLHDAAALAKLRALVKTPLTSGKIDGSGITGVEYGERLIEYVVKCALPVGSNVVVRTSTGDRLLQGEIGLTPRWAREPIDAYRSDKRWLTACLLAHANAYGVRVDILLTGTHEALQPAVPESMLPYWRVQEGAFYGDLFVAGDYAGPYLHACVGYDPQASCSVPIVKDAIKERVCARRVPDASCRFEVAGRCEDIDPTAPQDACTGAGGGYEHCGGGEFPRATPPSELFDEVITVHLFDRTAFEKMHPECLAGESAGQCGHDLCVTGGNLDPAGHLCAEDICAVDSFCCDSAWDGVCVSEVGSVCASNCTPTCHSVCEVGRELSPNCSTVASNVCTADPSCCSAQWDGLCINEAIAKGAVCP
ncbi:MAG: hypothetical protein HOW73_38260 [Polyangiaceae bacterium]|nr:hypothetical protein [Polyangiaceae bacterium]